MKHSTFHAAALVAFALSVTAFPTSRDVPESESQPSATDPPQIVDGVPFLSVDQVGEGIPWANRTLWQYFNVPFITMKAAYQLATNKTNPWTDAQAEAILAATMSPNFTYYNATESDEKYQKDLAEQQHIAHIYEALDANFTYADIYRLFHTGDRTLTVTDDEQLSGVPVRLSDA